MKFSSVKSVALDLCAFHLGDPEGSKEDIAMRAIRRVMDELSLHIHPNIVSEKKVISSNLTIQMPQSCMEVIKVGAVGGDNRIRIMGRDEDIRRGIADAPGCSCGSTETSSTENSCAACCFHNWIGDVYKGEAYGYRMPMFRNGVYRYNAKDNRIEFGSGYDVSEGNEVLVEYRAALGASEYALVPAPLAVAIMHKAASLLDARPSYSAYHMNEFRRSYYSYKEAINPYNEHDLIAALKGEAMSAVKF